MSSTRQENNSGLLLLAQAAEFLTSQPKHGVAASPKPTYLSSPPSEPRAMSPVSARPLPFPHHVAVRPPSPPLVHEHHPGVALYFSSPPQPYYYGPEVSPPAPSALPYPHRTWPGSLGSAICSAFRSNCNQPLPLDRLVNEVCMSFGSADSMQVMTDIKAYLSRHPQQFTKIPTNGDESPVWIFSPLAGPVTHEDNGPYPSLVPAAAAYNPPLSPRRSPVIESRSWNEPTLGCQSLPSHTGSQSPTSAGPGLKLTFITVKPEDTFKSTEYVRRKVITKKPKALKKRSSLVTSTAQKAKHILPAAHGAYL
ncbi:uncharacterized protein BJ171DRAFT_303976 [Polychytrium aggregatum]|uniref:uncharacterized protein n=1 Tax=Polychytrium aggregatum TaxID=110093 RepID=UPI0022FE6AE4|nr:uncharacterized protein BJ171DRAFT_303976 [Polychytrium aggregatum]KAI9193178.1 hypothetical protein BJ171DRAFT_303976 [Polychytrium aggregatum]